MGRRKKVRLVCRSPEAAEDVTMRLAHYEAPWSLAGDPDKPAKEFVEVETDLPNAEAMIDAFQGSGKILRVAR